MEYFQKQIELVSDGSVGNCMGSTVLLSSDIEISDNLARGIINAKPAGWIVFGENAEEINEKLDGVAREVDCDNVPDWEWFNDFKYAIVAALKKSTSKVCVLAGENTFKEIVDYLEEVKNKELTELKTLEQEVDKSSPSRFEK